MFSDVSLGEARVAPGRPMSAPGSILHPENDSNPPRASDAARRVVARVAARFASRPDEPLTIIQLKDGTHLTRQAVTNAPQDSRRRWLGRQRSDWPGRVVRIDARRLAMTRGFLDRISAQWDERLERR
jgi:hypothetical protein